MFDLLVKGGKVVFPNQFTREVDIGVRAGKITAIAEKLDNNESKAILKVEGKYIFPGIIDSHFHIGIYQPFAEDARSESASAAAGGVTTILSYFRSGKYYLSSGEPYCTLFKKVIEKSKGNFYTDYGFNLAPITKKHVREIPTLVHKDGISTFKYYMVYKGLDRVGEGRKGSVEKEFLLSDTPYDLGHLYAIMAKIASLKGVKGKVRLSIHAEDAEIIRINLERIKKDMKKFKLNPLEAYSMARPPSSERLAIIEAFELANETGCPINILHISGKNALDTVNEMRRVLPNVDVSVETTVSYLSLTTEANAGIQAKVNPPIRSVNDIEALWNGIQEGSIETVGSDHSSIKDSIKGHDLWTAETGYGVAELILPSLITKGHLERKVPLHKIASLISLNPSLVHSLYGKKGDIAVGFDADFVIFDPKLKKKVNFRSLHSTQDFTPFEGLELNGWAEITILRGEVIYTNGKFLREPTGKFIKRPVHNRGELN